MEAMEVNVKGMTCQHCAQSVTEAIGELPGVVSVDVDLETGNVDIASESPLDHGAVAEAVVDAGYAVAGMEERGNDGAGDPGDDGNLLI